MELKKAIRLITEIIAFTILVLTFLVNDIQKLKDSTMIEYLIEHWNWWVTALMFAGFVRYFRWVINEDIKETHERIIQSNVNLQELYIPDLAMNNLFIREVIIPNINEETFYKTLEFNVFVSQKFNIPQLEKFGIESKYIKRLKKQYHKIETENIK